MGEWHVKQVGDLPTLNAPILIEGLPGMGNVGKVAVDFIIDQLHPKKIYEFSSDAFPNCVFVNEKNLIDLPAIELYHMQANGQDFLLLAGDIQPSDEKSCFELTKAVLDVFGKVGGKEIVTLGGIGLHAAPKKPKVYCTGNCENTVTKYKSEVEVSDMIYGVVGPIVGVTGLLLGLSKQRDMKSVAYLAETFGHPMYLGVNGAKQLLTVLNKKLNLSLDLEKIGKEIEDLEEEIAKADIEPPKVMPRRRSTGDTAYIG